jgi:predicted outer membrane repeat protein
MRLGWFNTGTAIVGTVTLCVTLALLPRLLEAGGAVTDCADQVDLEAKLAGGGLVTFNCGGMNAPATIPITSTLVITLPTTIDGGAVITLDGLSERRIISASAPLTLVNLTLWRGRVTGAEEGGAVRSSSAVTLDRVTVLSNTAGEAGGGLYAATVTVTVSTFQNNAARYGSGLYTEANAVITASTFQNNAAEEAGGGLYAFGNAVITGSTFHNNRSVNAEGGGLFAASSAVITGSTFQSNRSVNRDGGGLFAASSAVITASTFQSNTANRDGGGLFAVSSAVITASTFQSNTANRDGGGLWANSAVISASTFVSNTANRDGGGLWTGNAAVTASTFQSNAAEEAGGGLFAASSAVITASTFQSNAANTFGGGLWAGNAAVTASTFLSNSASSHGGAIRANGPLTVTNSTLHANTALTGSAIGNASASQPTRLAFSTLSANAPRALATSGGDLVIQASIAQDSIPVCAGSGARVLAGWNFLADNSCGAPYDHRDPLLGPLADNGGPTLTRALLVGSPAIDQASSCPATDQRGVSRPVGVACDVGAYEYGAAPTLTALQPASALQGGPAFTLIVTGTTFLSGTVALWNGSVRPTTVLNSTTLSVAIPAGDLSMAGTMTVTARYGQAADSVSNGLPFSVLTPTPTPSPTPTPTLTPTPTPQPTNGTRLLLPLISLNQRAE